jgi:hypothetical protein
MGEIAARLADVVIVTSDNPRSEDPEAIIREILEGAGPGVESLVDRREAIARAVGLASAGDVVVIAGKGHEQGQEFEGGRKVPFDDVTVARAASREVRCSSECCCDRPVGSSGCPLPPRPHRFRREKRFFSGRHPPLSCESGFILS